MIPASLRRLAFVAVAAASSATAQIDWQLETTGNPPSPYCGQAWDSIRERLVTYGGEINGVAQFTTREWDGSSWNNVPGFGPPALSRAAMAFDEARGVTVMFGGGNGGVFVDQTWTFDGTSWTPQSPANSPQPSGGAAMAYDRARQVVVLFGGFVASGNDSNQTWEWDGSNWTLRAVGASPTPRGAHRMVYDDANERVVMVGGYSTPAMATLADAWAFDGVAWSPLPSLPGTLCDEALAYDPTRRRVVLFGGLRIQGGVFTDLGETRELTTGWTARTAATLAPTGRNGGACAFLPGQNRVLMAGGTSSLGVTDQTWTMGPVQPASADEFGVGCWVTAGTRLVADSLPYTGSPFEQSIVDASPLAALGLIAWGVSDTIWGAVPLPLDLTAIGAPSCSLLVSVDVTSTVFLANGTGSVTWNMPNVPSAAGMQLFTQATVLDPSSPLALQIDMSSGLALVVGNP